VKLDNYMYIYFLLIFKFIQNIFQVLFLKIPLKFKFVLDKNTTFFFSKKKKKTI
jgi:hypothetical protein